MFLGRRRHRDSAPSVLPAGDDDDAGGSGLRSSLDEAFGKLRQRANSHASADSGRGSVDSPKRFSGLFKRRARKTEGADSDESAADGDNLGGGALSFDQPSPSDESLQLHRSVASSLLTEDSDSEASSSHDDTLAPKHADTLQPESKERRGSSPARKFKGAFGQKKSGTTESLKSTERGGGGGLGSLFAGGKKSRSSSKVSLVEDPLQDSEQAQQAEEQQQQPALKRIETPPVNTATSNPETPPSKLIHAPTTVLTPPTPTDLEAPPSLFKRPSSSSRAEHKPTNSNPNVVVTPSGSLVQRRARSATTNSNPPSKLSHVATVPLTPTLEEAKTPGGSLTQPSNSFFSSVFSAAQNAASSLSNITSINQGQKIKAPVAETENTGPAGGEEVVGGGSDQDNTDDAGAEKKQLAFRSVPEDDYLIDDYSAALQRDILLHGRLYVSEGHICFSSNILGWVTNLVISFDEVVSVEKKSTAVIFPNAIVITTLHARNVFASLVSRDPTYDLLVGIWKISHPNLKSSLNGVALDAGTGDKTEKADIPDVIDDGSEEGSEEEVYDEDDDDEDGAASFTGPSEGSIISDAEPVKSISRKPSANPVGGPVNGADAANGGAVANGAATGAQDFPGPATHAPTECGDEGDHFTNLLIDTTIPAPLGKVYSLMFGPASGTYMRKWLIEDQKSMDLQMEDDKKGLGEDRKSFSFSYIKPLNASIGPKQTKCMINSTLDQFDLDRVVTVTCSTQNPDVPNGNIFVVKTKYCLMWGPGNSTRLIMTFVIEWSGKSWLKGPIEKGTNDGQTQYAKDLVAGLKAAVSAKGPSKGGAKGGKKGGKRRKEASSPARAEAAAASPAAADKGSNWGLLEPLHGPLRPVTDMLPDFISAQVVIAFLLFLMFISWLRSPSSSARGGYGAHGSLGVPGLATPARIIAYEEMWRREESELWDWLEERVRMDRAAAGTPLQSQSSSTSTRKQQVKQMGERLDSDVRMNQRQIEEALRVTQERLEVLKEAVEKKRPAAATEGAAEAVAAAAAEEHSSSSPLAV
ncbi:putative gram domain containing protein [Diplodia seriata]|uniref:Putative gram domain containing protein n=1 Tax=Diplodia seriata TaxID=420778 RepID=A0A0G2GHM8_9PEZI|nr:putative gram domain containing protein [Diplodia seriata]